MIGQAGKTGIAADGLHVPRRAPPARWREMTKLCMVRRAAVVGTTALAVAEVRLLG
jgi:hypothetical protein